MAGRSRSASFATAYLISALQMTYFEAFNRVKAARPVININKGFELQLRMYAQARGDVYLAQQLVLFKKILALKQYRGRSEFYFHDLKVKKLPCLFQAPQMDPAGSVWMPATDRRMPDGENDGSGEAQESLTSRQYSTSLSARLENEHSASTKSQKRTYGSAINVDVEAWKHFRNSASFKRERGDIVGTRLPTFTTRTPDTFELHRAPYSQLSVPSHSRMRKVPSLRGLESSFCCAWCNEQLFCLANVVRADLVQEHRDQFLEVAKEPHMRMAQSLSSLVSVYDSFSSKARFQPPLSSRFGGFSKKSFTFDCVNDTDAESAADLTTAENNKSAKSLFTCNSSPNQSSKRFMGFGLVSQTHLEEGEGEDIETGSDTATENRTAGATWMIVHSEPALEKQVSTVLAISSKSPVMDGEPQYLNREFDPQYLNSASLTARSSPLLKLPEVLTSTSQPETNSTTGNSLEIIPTKPRKSFVGSVRGFLQSAFSRSPVRGDGSGKNGQLSISHPVESSSEIMESDKSADSSGAGAKDAMQVDSGSLTLVRSSASETPAQSTPEFPQLPGSYSFTKNVPFCIPSPPKLAGKQPLSLTKEDSQRWLDTLNLLVASRWSAPDPGHIYSGKNMCNSDTVAPHISWSIEHAKSLAALDYQGLHGALGADSECFVQVEYLPWMGSEVFDLPEDSGNIRCHKCKNTLGTWDWGLDSR